MIELVFLGGIVWAIVAAVQRHRGADQGDIGTAFSVRQMFIYIMLFAAMVISAMGLTGVFGELMSSASARDDSGIAGPLAMAVVGIPVLTGLAMWVRRIHDADPAERRSIGWSLYINAALVTTLSVGVGFAFATADNAIDGDWRAPAVAGFIVWAAAWVAHWSVWRRTTPQIMPRLHIWAGSIIGLWVGAISAAIVINGGIERAFAATSDVVAAADVPDVWLPVIGVVIGAAVWVWHWVRHGLGSPRTEGWHVTVLIFGVLAGLVSAVAGAGYGLYVVLEWLFGSPDTTSAVVQFEELSVPAAAAGVGLVVWRYFRSVLGPSAARARTQLDRVYDYLVSTVGLATVAIGVVMLVMALFAAVSPSISTGEGGGNELIAAITLFVVGVPVWGVAWRRAQAIAARDDEESGSSVRRSYLFGVFGVGGVVAFGALIGMLVVLFEALLGERTGAIAADLDLPAALLATTGVIAAYHWMVYRAERNVELPHARLRDVLLVGDGNLDANELAARLHARVRLLHRLDVGNGAAIDMDAVVEAIAHTPGEHLLVMTGSNGDVDVIPYE